MNWRTRSTRHQRRIFNILINCLLLHSLSVWSIAQSAPPKRQENDAVLYETSGRLINEFLEMFARGGGSSSANTRESYESGSGGRFLERNDVDRRRAPSTNSNDADERSKAWSELANQVLRVLRGEALTTTPIPTTTTPPSFAKRIGQLVPSFLNPFSENNDIPASTTPRPPPAFTFATLPTLPLFSFTTPKPKEDTIFSRISSLFSADDEKASKRDDGPQIDTGRNFERFVVREMAEGDNPLSSILGGKFKERGVEWRDGNLRFINKQGSKLLGSDLAVHDRSVDIPIDRWLLLVNELANSGSRKN